MTKLEDPTPGLGHPSSPLQVTILFTLSGKTEALLYPEISPLPSFTSPLGLVLEADGDLLNQMFEHFRDKS